MQGTAGCHLYTDSRTHPLSGVNHQMGAYKWRTGVVQALIPVVLQILGVQLLNIHLRYKQPVYNRLGVNETTLALCTLTKAVLLVWCYLYAYEDCDYSCEREVMTVRLWILCLSYPVFPSARHLFGSRWAVKFPSGQPEFFILPTWHRGGICGELLGSPKTSPECRFVALRLSPVVSLIHYIGNHVMVLSIRFFDGFVFWVGK